MHPRNELITAHLIIAGVQSTELFARRALFFIPHGRAYGWEFWGQNLYLPFVFVARNRSTQSLPLESRVGHAQAEIDNSTPIAPIQHDIDLPRPFKRRHDLPICVRAHDSWTDESLQ